MRNIGENTIEMKLIEEDYYELRVNGVQFGVWETSQLRHLIEYIDNNLLPWNHKKLLIG